MCNGRIKLEILKWLKRLKSIVQCASYLLLKTPIAENHLRFQGYIPVSSVAVDITMDEFNSSMLV